MRRLALAASIAILVTGTTAPAQVVDLSTVTCNQFVTSSKDEIGFMLVWLNAYYTAEDAPPILDLGKVQSDAQKLGEFCGRNPTVGLITAADKVMGGK